MKNEEEKMKQFCRAHDPVAVTAARLERLHAAVWRRIETAPQETVVPSTAVLTMGARLPLRPMAVMGLLFLLCGLFVGRQTGLSSNLYATKQFQGVSVLAMVEPWERVGLEGE